MLHFCIDKRACATEAQEFGFWQGLLRVVGSFGDCPRCLKVCPADAVGHWSRDWEACKDLAGEVDPRSPPSRGQASRG